MLANRKICPVTPAHRHRFYGMESFPAREYRCCAAFIWKEWRRCVLSAIIIYFLLYEKGNFMKFAGN